MTSAPVDGNGPGPFVGCDSKLTAGARLLERTEAVNEQAGMEVGGVGSAANELR